MLTRDTANGRVVVETWTYDTFGDLASQDVAVSGVPLFRRVLTRDTLGRVTKVDTTQGGSTHSAGYGYDAENRLASETLDGAPTHSWTFDADGHRLTADAVTSTYDATGRHMAAGATSFTWDAFGSLASRTEGGHTVTYQHDGDGHLLKVTDGATVIEYGYDARGRRISRKKNGAATTGWLYDSQWRVIAETDGVGAVQRRYVYTQQGNSPDLMVAGGKTYRLLHDERGSVLAVIDSATGAAAETVTYSAWGEVLTDSAPGVQSLKYAGGVFDADTGLVHFGARDYDSRQGRWLALEPLLRDSDYVLRRAAGGFALPADVYSLANPLNNVDITGFDVRGVNAAAQVSLDTYVPQLLALPGLGTELARLLMDPANIAFLTVQPPGGLIENGGGTTSDPQSRNGGTGLATTSQVCQQDAEEYHRKYGTSRPPLRFDVSDLGALIAHELGHAYEKLYGKPGTPLRWENARRRSQGLLPRLSHSTPHHPFGAWP